MNYEKLYYDFIEKYKTQIINEDVYTEKHHILPKHDGGTDESTNLVVVTYRQHRFLHKIRYKAFKQIGDRLSYKLMYGICENKKFEICSMAGKISGRKNVASGHISNLGKTQGPITGTNNVVSGFLDKIRHLANTPIQLEGVRQLGLRMKESGKLLEAAKIAWEVNRGRSQPLDEREIRRVSALQRMKNPEEKAKTQKAQRISCEKKTEEALQRAKELIENAERNSEYLEMKSNRSNNIFVSPEGLQFESPIFAAKYYKEDLEGYIVENWCKRNQFGWKRIPKTETT